MDETLDFVARYGYTALFVWTSAEQLGLPIPATPILLAAGALAGAGRLSVAAVLLVAAAASILADLVWYEIGRRNGVQVLRTLCRVSFEPDSCVRRTEQVFERYGVRTLLVAKFVPGLATVAPPMAGVIGMRAASFLPIAGAGALIYAGAYVGLGYLFSAQLEMLARRSLQLGRGLVVVLAGALAAYVLARFWQRRRFIRGLRTSRITVEELKGRLDNGEEMYIVDLRGRLDVEADPHLIPGAVQVSPDDLDARHEDIPRDRDIVLYCA